MKAFLGKIKAMNPVMPFCMVALCIIGAVFIHSACSIRLDSTLKALYFQHAKMAAIGISIYFIIAGIPYRKVLHWRWVLYAVTLALLVALPFAGTEIMGAKRWIFGIQPSELAKAAIVMVLARELGKRGCRRGLGSFFMTAAVAGLPMALVMLQPDLGTALVLVPTVLSMLMVSGVCPRLVWGVTLAGMLVAVLILGAIAYAERPDVPVERRETAIRLTCLRPHQVKRLQVFLFPDRDLYGSGYNRRQSEIAVGSGGFWGKGLGKGEQYTLGYLPPSIATNDFIFSVLAEERGFAGSLTVLLLFLGLLGSCTAVAFKCKDDTGRLFCVGTMTLVFSHMFINIAMTIGVMPITGLPLPFISYGRTFLLTLFVMLGLVQSVSVHGAEPEERF